jgi:hypothetical protein
MVIREDGLQNFLRAFKGFSDDVYIALLYDNQCFSRTLTMGDLRRLAEMQQLIEERNATLDCIRALLRSITRYLDDTSS